MKKRTWFLLAGMLLACVAHTETIDAVYFNPSRFGNYNALDIMNELQVGGTVTVNNKATFSAGTTRITNSNSSYNLSNNTGKIATITSTLDMPYTQIKPQQLSVSGTNSVLFSNKNAQSSMGRITGSSSAEAAIYADEVNIDSSARNLVLGTYSNRSSGVYDGQSGNLTELDTGVLLQLEGVPIKSIYYTINNTAGSFTSCKSPGTSAPQLKWYERLASDGTVYKVLGCEPETYSGSGGGDQGDDQGDGDLEIIDIGDGKIVPSGCTAEEWAACNSSGSLAQMCRCISNDIVDDSTLIP